jgi:hypothetical protein
VSLPKKALDAPAVYASPRDAERWRRLLFVQALAREYPECGPDFWRAGQTPEAWAAQWLPGVPWGKLAARMLRVLARRLPRQPGVSALPIAWSRATWDEPAEPEPRTMTPPDDPDGDGPRIVFVEPRESVPAFLVRWRRWAAAERRRLARVKGLERAKPLDPEHLRWLARRLHGDTYMAIADRSGRWASRDAARVVARAVKAAARTLAIPLAALQKQSP